MPGSARRRQPQRQIDPDSFTVPAPVGGVNARDALANMPETDAVSAVNCYGQTSYVQIPRNGCTEKATGLPGVVETVMAFNGTFKNKLFGVSGGNIYDVTVGGAVGAAVVAGLANSRLQHQLFNAGAGTILVWVNGADIPQWYNAFGQVTGTGSLAGGSGYAGGLSGTFTNVPLTGGSGIGLQGTFTVTTGAVTAVSITATGQNYTVGNVLGVNPASLGGSGSGFSLTVTSISDGWANTTISGTGLNPRNLITATVFKQRMWYVEQNTMNVWYSGTSAFQGTLTVFPLAGIFKKGGTLVNMATWTIDNVSGMDDYGVFISSEGEIAVYQGYDPAQAATWSLVGVFNIGRPIGRRCYTKYASDILIITADGLTPLSKAMLTDRTQEDAQLTYKILNAINNDVQDFNSNFGWQIIAYPLGNKLILNVPEGGGTSHQWVQNPIAKSWWRFEDWNANCWELQQDSLYFGENTRILQADVGLSDVGMAITTDCKPAFSYFGARGKIKNFLMAQPVFQANANIYPQITLNVDFADLSNPSPPFTGNQTSPWDTSAWDVTPWSGDIPNVSIKTWQGVVGLGYAASGRISMLLSNVSAQWFATNYLITPGGPV